MTTVLRSDDMRRINRLRIMEIVRRKGAISRSEIAQAVALSPATVSTISNDLIAEGVLVARGNEAAPNIGRGRPSVHLSVNPGFRHAVLIILKIGAINISIVDYAGAIVAHQDFHIDMENIGMDEFRATLIAEIRQTWQASGLDDSQLARISVGIQGTTDIAGQKLLRSPMTPLTDMPVAHWLETEFGAPARLTNDCDLIARALNWRDPERYHENFAAILLAHGVGVSDMRRIDEDVLAEGLRVDHPRFFAYVPGPSNYVSVLADLITTGRNVFGGTWQASAGAVELELVTVDWFREALGLPSGTGGQFVSGGSMANLTALAVAREVHGAAPDAPVYLSDQTHASVAKGLRVLGFKPTAIRVLPSDDAFRLDPAAVRAQLAEDRARGLAPFCLVANAGTTSTGAVDPLPELADLCAEEGLWLHVDGAYGAAAAITPEGATALAGIDRADSVSLDPHKWLFQPFETGLVLVRDRESLRRTFATQAVYMRDAERAGTAKLPEPNPFEHGVQLTRSVRALKVWTSLQTFGVAAFRDAVARGFELAQRAEADLRARSAFEVVTPATMGIVTFRHLPGANAAGAELDEHQRALARRLAEDGFAMLSTTELRGRVVLRMCTINPRTRDEDVRATLDRLERLASDASTTS